MASSSTTQQPVSVGPFGGQDGRSFDDGTFPGIRKIVIAAGDVVDSISIEYANNDDSVTTTFHGGNGGDINTIILDYPDEFLISVWGSISNYVSNDVVGSLTLQSNKNTYGPFGVLQQRLFSFPSTGEKIIGFHGKSSGLLNAIGAYLEPTTPNSPSTEISLIGTVLSYLVSVITIGIELSLTIRGDDGKKASSGSFIMSCVLFAFSVGITITTARSYLMSRKNENSHYETVLNILDLITVSGLLIDNSIGMVYLLTESKIKLLRIPASVIAATTYLIIVRRPVKVCNCFFRNRDGDSIPITLSSANSTDSIFVYVSQSSYILPEASSNTSSYASSTSTASTIFQPFRSSYGSIFRKLHRRFADIDSRG